ncbi:anthranilate synthase component 1 [Ferrimonas sp. SCSIO 43195]|uniref:anthranilate synthase component 1 n=1 Tax=Ferrimonas sp. SCSIO 43195 TaxID=2822844 RepID=UPI002075210F|nr:anthranilate synthase component 1 [Ferrimonas sp. SCSIO 43195]USD36495.1 anthranilate synthase component 1 [Ferrimonas sp. SCSIO 43195]
MTELQPGHSHTLTLTCRYQHQPAALFQALCGDKANSMLLESAEVDTKAGTQSLLMIDAALRIECNGRQVRCEPLTLNGESLIPLLSERLAAFSPQLQQGTLCLTVPEPPRDLDEDSRLKAPSPLSVLRLIQQSIEDDDACAQSLLLTGAFAFDLVASVEPLPTVSDGPNNCPDFLFYLAETTLVIDHVRRTARLVGALQGGDYSERYHHHLSQRLADLARQVDEFDGNETLTPAPTAAVSINQDDALFRSKVEQLKQHIRAGDIFQVVPARRFSLPCPQPLEAYARLRRDNPSPYMFVLQDASFTLFGASPESALKYSAESNQVEIYPIAGTRKRGRKPGGELDHDLDARIELGLRQDQKETAEHMMLVDLARNDIARISQPGSRQIPELLKVDRYSHVMHLVSRVTGQLRTDLDALHAYQACMNMGTLTGAPKVRAAQLLRQAEGERRGSYGGAVGYLNGRGDMDTCIVIRSALVNEGTAHVQAGAGVVFDSDPQSEADETCNKAMAVIRAIGGSL